jgi:hypothetical protein
MLCFLCLRSSLRIAILFASIIHNLVATQGALESLFNMCLIKSPQREGERERSRLFRIIFTRPYYHCCRRVLVLITLGRICSVRNMLAWMSQYLMPQPRKWTARLGASLAIARSKSPHAGLIHQQPSFEKVNTISQTLETTGLQWLW